jgi:hypothetical protein
VILSIIRNADMNTEHQISAFPPTKQQEENRDQGQQQAIGNDRRGALLAAFTTP